MGMGWGCLKYELNYFDGNIKSGNLYFNITAEERIEPEFYKKWEANCEDVCAGSVAAAHKGNIYHTERSLMKYSMDGKIESVFTREGRKHVSAPVIGADDTVYFLYGTCYTGLLFAINNDGTEEWFEPLGGSCSEVAPSLSKDGTLYYGSARETLYALSLEGKIKWSFNVKGEITESPVIGTDGSIYAASCGKKLYALNPDGNLKWVVDLNSAARAGLSIGDDGTIYVPTEGLCAYTPDGILKWEFKPDLFIQTTPIIGKDGNIYIGTEWFGLIAGYVKYSEVLEGFFYSITPQGKVKWKLFLNGKPHSSVVGKNGLIYVLLKNENVGSNVLSINPEGRVLDVIRIDRDAGYEMIMDSEGTLYFGVNATAKRTVEESITGGTFTQSSFNDDSGIYAVHTRSGGYAGSAWPMYHQNPQNTNCRQ